MSYVDKVNRFKGTYDINCKNHKLWHHIFFHFIDVKVVNTFILFFIDEQRYL